MDENATSALENAVSLAFKSDFEKFTWLIQRELYMQAVLMFVLRGEREWQEWTYCLDQAQFQKLESQADQLCQRAGMLSGYFTVRASNRSDASHDSGVTYGTRKLRAVRKALGYHL